MSETLPETGSESPTDTTASPLNAGGGADFGSSRETQPDALIGKVLGGLYRIKAKIGEGGMGSVYAASHQHLQRSFAIKVLADKAAADRKAVERLRQEAVTASSIDHEGIVDVVSFDETADGTVFIVMELLSGQSLGELIETEAPLEPARALDLGRQIAQALQAAHARGIVHRDLKPENVFLVPRNEEERVKILDFGISKVQSADIEKVRMTRTGQLVGTPLYMSPEQAKGESIDHRADIYALGVLLFELLTGTPPFEGRNYFQLLWKHGNEAPAAPSTLVPELSSAIDALLLKALAKSPDARFPSMGAFDEELSAAQQAPPPATRNSVRWKSLLLIAALATAVVAVVAALTLNPEETPSPQNNDLPPTRVRDDAPAANKSPPVSAGTALAPAAGVSEESEPFEPTVHVTSSPAGAQVTIGGTIVGETPLEYAFPSDEAVEASFELSGYRRIERTLQADDGTTVHVRLRARQLKARSPTRTPIKTSYR